MPELTQYAANGRGARQTGFSLEGCSVTVDPPVTTGEVEDDNKAAWDLATRLATAPAEVEQLREENGRLAAQIVRQNKPPAKLLGKGFVRFLDGKVWILNRRVLGFGEFGLRFDSWDMLFRFYDVRVTGHGQDEHGPWWSVESMQ